MSNGSTFENIKAAVFKTSTGTPYLINKCTNDFSEVGLGKGNGDQIVNISYGRSGVIVKNTLESLTCFL